MNKTFVIAVTVCFSCALIGVIDAGIFSSNRSNDLIIGVLRPGDRILHSANVTLAAVKKNYAQQDITVSGVRNITRIEAFDQFRNGTGGNAFLIGGGVGKNNMTLRLKSSDKGRGLSFKVNIYGY